MKAHLKLFLKAIINVLIQLQKKKTKNKKASKSTKQRCTMAKNIGKSRNWHKMINEQTKQDVQTQVKL